ncbi:MAG: hypothetical protein SVT56_06075 [Chloroflexota bacterium]|jgi:hypothetical protein|nr:hypothetical protein [Chloroflexota bacterium]
MPFTYTYTARNKADPDQVMTFTIIDNHIKVNLTGLVDQVSDAVKEEDRKTAINNFLSTQSGSAIYKAVERISGLVHINDVSPHFEEGQFKLTFWKRIAGLRFAPITLAMGSVDNPEAAAQFIDTLLDRQEQVEEPGFFSGPLDYWATWITLLVGAIILIKWPRKNKS